MRGIGFLVILLIGAGFYWSKLKQVEVVLESEPSPTVTKDLESRLTLKKNEPAIQIQARPLEPIKVEASQNAQPNFNQYPFKLKDKDAVEFRVSKSGYAVAFGDVLLGRTPDEHKSKEGIYEPTRSKLWPSPVIAYAIQPEVQNSQVIHEAIEYLNKNTPIRLVPFKDEEDVLVFVADEELCASYLGRVGGQQPILIAKHCRSGDVLHEIMHALGFVHEHSRQDRDQYIEVLWPNIKEDFYLQFHIVPDSLVHEYRGSVFDFDFNSIMLYSGQAFQKASGLETLRSKGRGEIRPSKDVLSPIDRERLYYLYSGY